MKKDPIHSPRTSARGPAWLLALLAGAAAVPGIAWGEQPAPPQQPSAPAADSSASEEQQLSPEDLADIEAALRQDAADESAHQAHLAQPPPGRGATGGALQSLNPDIAVIGDVAAGWFSEEPFLPGGHDPQKTGFTLQQLELSFAGAVDPYFRLDAFIVFTSEGVEVEEAVGTTVALPGNLQVRGGKFLTRFGRQNATHPHSWEFVDQAFPIVRVFGGDANRGLGVETSWLAPLPWYVEVVGSLTEASGEGTARSFYGEDDLGVETPLDLQATGALKQFFPLSDDWSLLLGLSAAGGPNAVSDTSRTAIWGADLYLKWRPVTEASEQSVSLQAEGFWRRRHVVGDRLQDFSAYGQLAWRIDKRWGVAARWEWGGPSLLSGGEAGADYLDPDWTEDRHRVSANVTFWPTEFSRLRLQTAWDRPLWADDPIWSAALAFEFSTGAHAAHAF